MDREDLLAVESTLRDVAAQFGFSDVLESELFNESRRNVEGGLRTLFSPRMRVYEQIMALERMMSLYDRSVVTDSLATIKQVLSEGYFAKGATLGVPERVQIEIPTDRDSPEQSFDLLELPDLGQLRVRLRQLATEVLESGD